MKKLFLRKLLLLAAFIISVQSFAAFIGNIRVNDDRTKKISLKNFTRNGYHVSAYPSFRLSQFLYKGSRNIGQVNSIYSAEGSSIIRFQNGNTTYLYPYKYKIKAPLFKAPVSPNRSNH